MPKTPLSIELLQKIVTYLEQRPYAEVVLLFQGIQAEFNAARAAEQATVVASPLGAGVTVEP